MRVFIVILVLFLGSLFFTPVVGAGLAVVSAFLLIPGVFSWLVLAGAAVYLVNRFGVDGIFQAVSMIAFFALLIAAVAYRFNGRKAKESAVADNNPVPNVVMVELARKRADRRGSAVIGVDAPGDVKER